MARFGMVIDTAKCVGCMDCVVACQTENDVPTGYCRDWITTEVRGTFPTIAMEIRSERCNHCDNPPCVQCCPTGASHVEPVGRTVQVTANRCIGCKACIGLHRFVSVRRALRAPQGLRRQVHVLPAPHEGRQGPGVRRCLPDPLHVFR